MSNVFIVLAVLARFLYVSYVGLALKREEKRPTLPWPTFKRRAAAVMNFDTAVFILAVMATAGELTWLPGRWLMAAGIVLTIAGLLAKYLAFRTLGTYGYYYGDFFSEREVAPTPIKKGIYKYMDNPMYILGYAHAYGWALLWLSWKGLLLAAFYQAAILAFYFLVERPHFLKIYQN